MKNRNQYEHIKKDIQSVQDNCYGSVRIRAFQLGELYEEVRHKYFDGILTLEEEQELQDFIDEIYKTLD